MILNFSHLLHDSSRLVSYGNCYSEPSGKQFKAVLQSFRWTNSKWLNKNFSFLSLKLCSWDHQSDPTRARLHNTNKVPWRTKKDNRKEPPDNINTKSHTAAEFDLAVAHTEAASHVSAPERLVGILCESVRLTDQQERHLSAPHAGPSWPQPWPDGTEEAPSWMETEDGGGWGG